MFNPQNWYWAVGGSTTQVYSSVSNTYVPVADATYAAWLAAGNNPAPIPAEADIWPYMAPIKPSWLFDGTTFAQPAVGAYTKTQLIAYCANARWLRQTGGITVATFAYLTDRVSSNERNTAYNYGLANTAATFSWKLPDGTFTTLTATQLTHVETSENGFVQACFNCEETTDTSINGGTITTTAAIDAAFAAISNVFA
jgi:hypothetical protein